MKGRVLSVLASRKEVRYDFPTHLREGDSEREWMFLGWAKRMTSAWWCGVDSVVRIRAGQKQRQWRSEECEAVEDDRERMYLE